METVKPGDALDSSASTLAKVMNAEVDMDRGKQDELRRSLRPKKKAKCPDDKDSLDGEQESDEEAKPVKKCPSSKAASKKKAKPEDKASKPDKEVQPVKTKKEFQIQA